MGKEEWGLADWRAYNSEITAILESENKLIATRMQWSLAVQGFLFTAHFASSIPDEMKIVVALIGWFFAAYAAIGIAAAYKNVERIKKKWDEAAEVEGSELNKGILRPFSDDEVSKMGRTNTEVFVGLVFVAWILVGAFDIVNYPDTKKLQPEKRTEAELLSVPISQSGLALWDN